MEFKTPLAASYSDFDAGLPRPDADTTFRVVANTNMF